MECSFCGRINTEFYGVMDDCEIYWCSYCQDRFVVDGEYYKEMKDEEIS
jgi:hypothetical protein